MAVPSLLSVLSTAPEGVRLTVRAQPRSSREGIVGLVDCADPGGKVCVALKVAVMSPPVDGEANAAIVRVVARSLGLPKTHVTVLRGDTGRTKTLLIRGLSLELCEERLSALPWAASESG